MPTPKNKFLDAVWDRIGKEREEQALYRRHVRGTPDDVEDIPLSKRRPYVPEPKPAAPRPPAPKRDPSIAKKQYEKLSQDQLAQISMLTWDHYTPQRIGELMGLETDHVKQAIKEMRLIKTRK